MHGNVLERCQDWYSPYLCGIAIDPQGPATVLRGYYSRAQRGGSWSSSARGCRSAHRLGDGSPDWADTYGFRIALAPGQP